MLREHSTGDIGLLKEAVKFLGLKWIFTDYDDTIADTSYEYVSRMKNYSMFIAEASGADMEGVLSFMGKTLNGLRPTFSVHPNLMAETARITALRFGLDHNLPQIRNQFDILMEIYQSVPKPFDNVKDTLISLGTSGLKLAVITHADKQWAESKIRGAGLYFDKLFSIPSSDHKNALQWTAAINSVCENPNSILAVGDSWNSDITPAIKAGIPKQNIIRIKTSYSHSNVGKVDGIREINTFREVQEVLLSHLL